MTKYVLTLFLSLYSLSAFAQTDTDLCKTTNLGLTSIELSTGRFANVWYPTESVGEKYRYSSGWTSTLTKDAPMGTCSRPLVIFSHGFSGCSTQILFLVESLARAGYIVAAPNHLDQDCSNNRVLFPVKSFAEFKAYTAKLYVDRRDDIDAVVSYFDKPELLGVTDPARIAISGHSLGGYAALEIAGGWDSWSNNRIRAALAFSPYANSLLYYRRLSHLEIPVMYQSGSKDVNVLPFIHGSKGAYAKSPSPKYLAVF